MISYMKGILTGKEEESILLEINQIGYEIRMPSTSVDTLPKIGETITVFTYLYVREDALQLFGFLSKDDLNLFQLLLSVSGIGPKGALTVLSVLSGDELRFAVFTEDVKTLSKAPGIGAKTAKRLIIELKDRLKIEDVLEVAKEPEAGKYIEETGTDVTKEAILALSALGYSKTEAARAVKMIEITDTMSVEEVLKLAFTKLSL